MALTACAREIAAAEDAAAVLDAVARAQAEPGALDGEFLDAVAALRALGLDGVRRRRLLEIAAALAAAADQDAMLSVLADALVPDLADWCAVHLTGPDGIRLELATVAHRDPTLVAPLGKALEKALADAPHAAAQAAVTLPLRAHGRAIGSLRLGRDGRGLDDHERRLAAEVAGFAAAAFADAAAHRAVVEAADSLQRALLPQSLPVLPALEVAAHYAPSFAGAGGDWYDAFELPGGRLGFAVGDTMGRGVAATAAMGQARAALRGFALEGHGPAEVLRRLDLVVRAFDDLQLTTCAFAVYDPIGARLTVASAGHLPPLLLDAAGEGGYLDPEVGVPLGAGGMQHGSYCDLVLAMHPGATVVMFTDGLLRRGSGDDVEAALAGVLRAAAGAVGGPVGDVLAAVLGVEPHAAHAVDDVAVVAVRAAATEPLPEGGSRTLEVELPASLQAARIARARVLGALTEWGHGGSDDAGGPGGFEVVDAVVLLTDELVTNAVVHAQSPLRMRLTLREGSVRVEVTDESPRLPSPRGQDISEGLDAVAEGGRGLRLVELIASRWGVEPLSVGKRIWFEVELREA